MKNMLLLIYAGVPLAGTLTGCTTEAGPFVTNIYSDGKGDIVVEKHTVVVNGFTGTVSEGGIAKQEVIRVVPAQQ